MCESRDVSGHYTRQHATSDLPAIFKLDKMEESYSVEMEESSSVAK